MEEGDEKVEIIKDMDAMKEIGKAIVAFIQNWGELAIAAVSLIIAVIALVKSSKAEKLQNRVNEMEIKIKEYELARIAKEKEDSELSCVEARLITIGKSKHRLKVWNSGNTTVYGVTARFDGDPGIILMDHDKQPFDELEPGKSYELIAIPHGQCAPKFKIITEWTDMGGNCHSKSQMGDI